MSRSPTRSSELERILSCGSAVCTITLGFFGLVTSTAVTFFGCDSWAIHSTRRRSRVRWMAMPSPQLPKPSSGWCASKRIVAIGSHLSLGLTTAPTPFLIGLDKGVPYVAIGVNSLFCGSTHLVVLKQSDVNSVAQLKGKRVGLPKGTITEFVFVRKVAPAHGLKATEFQVANIPDAKDSVPSLVAKAVDLTALGDPFVAIAEHEGVIRVLEDFCRYDVMPFMLTATTKIVQDNPAAVVAYLRGWLRAVKVLKEEPEKAAQVYLDDLKSLGREVPLPVLDRALRRMRWEPEVTPQMDRYLADMARDMLASTSGERLRAMPDLARSVNKDLLRKAMASR